MRQARTTVKGLIPLLAAGMLALSSTAVASATNGFIGEGPFGYKLPPASYTVGDTLSFSFTLHNEGSTSLSQCLELDLLRLGIFADSTLDENQLADLVDTSDTQQVLITTKSLGTIQLEAGQVKTVQASVSLGLTGIFQFDVIPCGASIDFPIVAGFVRVLAPAPPPPPPPAPAPQAGALSITKTCDAGVSLQTQAEFSIRLGEVQVATAGVTCGSTVRVTFLGPLAANIVAGTQVKIVETKAPPGAKKAEDLIVTLTASAEPPVTINNKAEAGGGVGAVQPPPSPTAAPAAPTGGVRAATVTRLAATGGGPTPEKSPIPGAIGLLGVLLIGAGALLLRRRRA